MKRKVLKFLFNLCVLFVILTIIPIDRKIELASASESKDSNLIEKISKDYTKKFCNSIGFGLSKESAMNFSFAENKEIFKNRKGIENIRKELLAQKIAKSVVDGCGYKLDLYEEEIRLRQEVANLYSENLTGNKNIQTPFVPKDYQSVWAQYSILLENSKKRGNVIESLGNEGIPSVVYYQKSLHIQKTFKNLGYKMGDFPISENVSSRILSLPMHPYLDQLSIDKISEIIKSSI